MGLGSVGLKIPLSSFLGMLSWKALGCCIRYVFSLFCFELTAILLIIVVHLLRNECPGMVGGFTHFRMFKKTLQRCH
jgi:hypothetical protein